MSLCEAVYYKVKAQEQDYLSTHVLEVNIFQMNIREHLQDGVGADVGRRILAEMTQYQLRISIILAGIVLFVYALLNSL